MQYRIDHALRGAATAALLAALTVACGGGGGAKSTPTPAAASGSPTAALAATATPTPATATVAATAALAFEGTRGPVTGTAPGADAVVLKDVRAGSGQGFDTVVFEFNGAAVSGFTVQYVDKVPSCPAPPTVAPPPSNPGTPATRGRATATPTPEPQPTEPPTPTPTPFGAVAGKAMIAVVLNPAITAGLNRTDFRGGQGALAQATQVCESQNMVAWVLGVASAQPFRVTVLANPPRLVIDVQK